MCLAKVESGKVNRVILMVCVRSTVEEAKDHGPWRMQTILAVYFYFLSSETVTAYARLVASVLPARAVSMYLPI